MNKNLKSEMKKGENLFIVDLESVSFFNQETLNRLTKENNRYKEIPFLYLIASYSRNEAMNWAIKNFSYEGKIKKGAWMIYKFKN